MIGLTGTLGIYLGLDLIRIVGPRSDVCERLRGFGRAAAAPTTADGGARRRVAEGSPAYRELMILVTVLARVCPGSKDTM